MHKRVSEGFFMLGQPFFRKIHRGLENPFFQFLFLNEKCYNWYLTSQSHVVSEN